MTTSYEFKSESNWNLAYTSTLIAEEVPNKNLRYYYPIPDFQIPVLFTSSIVGILATSTDDPGTWRKAGYARQISSTLDPNVVPNIEIISTRLNLKKTTICFFKKTEDNYSIEVGNIPYWLRNLSLKIWEYTGAIADDDITASLIAEIKTIEDKIDLLL